VARPILAPVGFRLLTDWKQTYPIARGHLEARPQQPSVAAACSEWRGGASPVAAATNNSVMGALGAVATFSYGGGIDLGRRNVPVAVGYLITLFRLLWHPGEAT
jgi:hypothetical protein